jgi:hypothetical protein
MIVCQMCASISISGQVRLSYDHTIDCIKTRFYAPKLHTDVEYEPKPVRRKLARAITVLRSGIRSTLLPNAPCR